MICFSKNQKFQTIICLQLENLLIFCFNFSQIYLTELLIITLILTSMIQNFIRAYFFQSIQNKKNKFKMKKGYNFSQQMKHLNQIIDINIVFAQSCNKYLKKLWRPLVKRVVQELKDQYHEEQLLKQPNEENEIRYNAIKSALNLVARQGVTNVDELFMGLAKEMKDYYDSQYINKDRNMNYFHQCTYCQKRISNTLSGLKRHQRLCQKNSESNDNLTEHKNTKTNSSEIIVLSQNGQICKKRLLKEKKLRKRQSLFNQQYSLKEMKDIKRIDQYFNKQDQQQQQSLIFQKKYYSTKFEENVSQNEDYFSDESLMSLVDDSDDDFIR